MMTHLDLVLETLAEAFNGYVLQEQLLSNFTDSTADHVQTIVQQLVPHTRDLTTTLIRDLRIISERVANYIRDLLEPLAGPEPVDVVNRILLLVIVVSFLLFVANFALRVRGQTTEQSYVTIDGYELDLATEFVSVEQAPTPQSPGGIALVAPVLLALIACPFLVYTASQPANRTIAGISVILGAVLTGCLGYILLKLAHTLPADFAQLAQSLGMQPATLKSVVVVVLTGLLMLTGTRITIRALVNFIRAGVRNVAKVQPAQATQAVDQAVQTIRNTDLNEVRPVAEKTGQVIERALRVAGQNI